MKKIIVGLMFVLVACQPETSTSRFTSAACNQYLPGSQQLADVDSYGTPIVCEPRLNGTPSLAEGWFDGTTIHVWPAALGEPDSYVLKVAAHEYGHDVQSRHPDWVYGDAEQFAESWAWCNYPHVAGSGYRFTGAVPSAGDCAVFAYWYSNR